jgi:hypothetical protein
MRATIPELKKQVLEAQEMPNVAAKLLVPMMEEIEYLSGQLGELLDKYKELLGRVNNLESPRTMAAGSAGSTAEEGGEERGGGSKHRKGH